jgi:ParB-like chromosome segregation protein Spo0J
MSTAMPVAAIKVGIRHRKDMGDIEGLARSIAEVSLLHPIVVRADGTLIAGERRLATVGRSPGACERKAAVGRS